MENTQRKPRPRAVIFDVYQTLLDVMPPPTYASERWAALWAQAGGESEAPELEAFSARCRSLIDRDHQDAKASGIPFPEISWPGILLRTLPGLGNLSQPDRERWMLEHQACLRRVTLAPGADAVLGRLRDAGIPLGIASNAQSYTLTELDAAFYRSEAGLEQFEPDLRVWSYECGFSKPDPHIFRILTARLAERGIGASETLMVGDRIDNDITPAQSAGWQTWHLRADTTGLSAGPWGALECWLEEVI